MSLRLLGLAAVTATLALSGCGSSESAGNNASNAASNAASAASQAGSAAASAASEAATNASSAATDAASAASTAAANASTAATDAASGAAGTYTLAQVAEHKTEADCWTAIKAPGQTETGVYDVTTWVAKHPGGPMPIKSLCGKDSTQAFLGKHGEDGPKGEPEEKLASFKIGVLKG